MTLSLVQTKGEGLTAGLVLPGHNQPQTYLELFSPVHLLSRHLGFLIPKRKECEVLRLPRVTEFDVVELNSRRPSGKSRLEAANNDMRNSLLSVGGCDLAPRTGIGQEDLLFFNLFVSYLRKLHTFHATVIPFGQNISAMYQ